MDAELKEELRKQRRDINLLGLSALALAVAVVIETNPVWSAILVSLILFAAFSCGALANDYNHKVAQAALDPKEQP